MVIFNGNIEETVGCIYSIIGNDGYSREKIKNDIKD